MAWRGKVCPIETAYAIQLLINKIYNQPKWNNLIMASYRISIPESILKFIAKEINDWRENAYELGLDLEDVFQFNTTLVKKLKEINSGSTLPNNPKSSNGNLKPELVQRLKEQEQLKSESSEFTGLTGDQMMQKLLEEQEQAKQKLEQEKQTEAEKAKSLFDESEL